MDDDLETYLTSTTAPDKIFRSRVELAQHYKSDWHKYNCKRKEAGLPLLKEEDFNARLQAALALKREQEGRQRKDGVSHLKDKGKKRTNKVQQQVPDAEVTAVEELKDEEQLEPPVVDPCQSLFDNSVHPTVAANVQYMKQTYGFFVPDSEYLVNLSSLIGYCQEKIQIGQMCLYCQRGFRSPRAVKDHMVGARHTKIRYEEGIDLWEFEPFYDFTEANKEFWETWNNKKKSTGKETTCAGSEDYDYIMKENENAVVVEDDDEEDSTEWEDVKDGIDEQEDEEEEDYNDYAVNLAQQGFDVTPLGELIFPDGRIVGHRLLARFYKQRLARDKTTVARTAAMVAENWNNSGSRMSAADRWASANNILARQQTGILVRDAGSNSFSAISLYRYKAVIKKSRREEARGKRLHQKTALNINRMGKKDNRLMNGVSVAHAKR
jgi:pre-60S factor REI1